jgi:hypothetical protein
MLTHASDDLISFTGRNYQATKSPEEASAIFNFEAGKSSGGCSCLNGLRWRCGKELSSDLVIGMGRSDSWLPAMARA